METQLPQVKDSFLNLERHRRLLEDNVAKLQKSLRHWQTWEAEYEGFKEELAAAKPSTSAGLLQLARSYEADLLTQGELDDLLGIKNGGKQRSPDQVNGLLSRRLDYVQQNVKTAARQLEIFENKLAAATVISAPDVRNEDGLPLTDIIEELDEEGNVIASRTSTPGSSQSHILEVLKKAGINDLADGDAEAAERERLAAQNAIRNRTIGGVDVADTAQPSRAIRSTPGSSSDSSATASLNKPPKKSVKFAASESEDESTDSEIAESEPVQRPPVMSDQVKFREPNSSVAPIIPTNESPEDAALRREMLNYSMNEVGTVVAELSVEDSSDYDGEDYDDDDEEEEDADEESDDEDEYGRSTRRVVTDDIRREMEELERRLGLRMQNVGPQLDASMPVGEDARTAVQPDLVAQPSSSPEKAVRFAEQLDIAPQSAQPMQGAVKIHDDKPAPLGDIVERAPQAAAPPSVSASRKPSRFKSSRLSAESTASEGLPTQQSGRHTIPHGAGVIPLFPASSGSKPFSGPIEVSLRERTRTAPTGPKGKILAPSIVEHDLLEAPAEPDELDPSLLQQEVAVEYHKIRNRMIQRQGGFVRDLDEEEHGIVPLTEEEGGPKKVSRFKAARLRRT